MAVGSAVGVSMEEAGLVEVYLEAVEWEVDVVEATLVQEAWVAVVETQVWRGKPTTLRSTTCMSA